MGSKMGRTTVERFKRGEEKDIQDGGWKVKGTMTKLEEGRLRRIAMKKKVVGKGR